MSAPYTRATTPGPGILDTDSRAVYAFEGDQAIQFRCPCGRRLVYITAPPHGITFDDDGRLTLDGSVGSPARAATPRQPARPENWCHFGVIAGAPAMYADAQCPGAPGGAA